MNVCFEARSQNVTYFHVALETFWVIIMNTVWESISFQRIMGVIFFFSFLLVILAMSFPLVPLSTG